MGAMRQNDLAHLPTPVHIGIQDKYKQVFERRKIFSEHVIQSSNYRQIAK